ncbi:DNA topoisomerase I [Sphingopyxis sp. Root1497]|uniref:type I DNA topoisomerase n=1 Tax=Sphingopyxis sp. Root1497 TaxID=1736474 RepID=UPI000700C023|nr:type I DNA topoisomerase [Sphingopyxis sp. Root1497]KQZ62402.1 DNA topoisomerase I [Sphingopyxis sp. Root1497]
MQLVIVESPAKAKTIEKYLGRDFKVLASYGHVRDLPPKDGSVNPDDGFAMQWQLYPDKTKRMKEIQDAAKGAERLILATDPDREGEAISWHVQELLRSKKALPAKVDRVTFNAITKDAVLTAMAAPRALDDDLIDAYRARRALDYLVGFTLSPVLWRKLPGAKSAGRVQSVSLRLIVEREREIEAFVALQYWSITGLFEMSGTPFKARLARWRGDKIERLTITSEADARAAEADVKAGHFTVENVETKPLTRNPPPPFTTSTLQQEAARKLGFSASHTMRIAQGLYEDGAITYMRTDGVQMDGSAISAARKAIATRYDGGYVPDQPRQYQTKAKNAQEAHEAIRPTDFSKDKAGSGDHGRLYELIWKRAMASQMASARLERTSIDLSDGTGKTMLRATGQVVKFPGFLALYDESRDDAGDDDDARLLPAMAKGDAPAKTGVEVESHETQPPPRYSEASLVKKMEELGIGRPSTYASILQVLKDRAYVTVEKNRFMPEESGRLLTAFLERYFTRYVEYDYTAGLEEELDDVSGGRAQWQAVLDAFWRDFKPRTGEVMELKPSEITAALDEFLGPYLFPDKGDGSDPRLCPNCGTGKLALRGGKFGPFIACSNYPDCKFTRKFAQPGGSDGADTGPETMGNDPESGLEVTKRSGRFGPYIQLGDGKEAKRSSIPKDIPGEDFDLDYALRLLSLPREVGVHPESGKVIMAGLGRYGPYLLHDGKYAKLTGTTEIFDIGMNAAVVRIAEAAAGGGRGRTKAEPLNTFGPHPTSGGEMKLMEGRFGPYVTDGTTNATLPKSMEPAALTLEEAIALIDARAAKGPAKGKKKAAPKKAAAKKPAAKKKAPAKKAVAE